MARTGAVLLATSMAMAWVAACTGNSDPDFGSDDDASRGAGGATSQSSSTGSATGGGTQSSSSSGSGGGVGGGSLQPACDAPAESPSKGSCVTLGGDVECNPVTNEPCSEVCAHYGDGRYQCYTVTGLSQPCGECSTYLCTGGYACPERWDWPGGERCAKYCCDDSDCGSGFCSKEGIAAPGAPVGICLSALP